MNGCVVCQNGIQVVMELKRLRDSAKRASMVPLIHAGTTRYVDDVRVGDELEVTKPNEPDFRKTGRVRVHHLGEPRHLIIVLDDAEGLGARKGKAKKKNKKRKRVRRSGDLSTTMTRSGTASHAK